MATYNYRKISMPVQEGTCWKIKIRWLEEQQSINISQSYRLQMSSAGLIAHLQYTCTIKKNCDDRGISTNFVCQ